MQIQSDRDECLAYQDTGGHTRGADFSVLTESKGTEEGDTLFVYYRRAN